MRWSSATFRHDCRVIWRLVLSAESRAVTGNEGNWNFVPRTGLSALAAIWRAGTRWLVHCFSSLASIHVNSRCARIVGNCLLTSRSSCFRTRSRAARMCLPLRQRGVEPCGEVGCYSSGHESMPSCEIWSVLKYLHPELERHASQQVDIPAGERCSRWLWHPDLRVCLACQMTL